MNDTEQPTSSADLIDRLRRLPLQGKSVLVDAFVADAGAAAELVAFLRGAVGSDGTIVVPTFTQERTLSDRAPRPVAFHADLEVDAALGQVPEAFRRNASTLRSSHPCTSFAASGSRSQMLLSTNLDNNPLGPVKKLNLLNALSLRIGLGVEGFPSNTPLHLAEAQSMRRLRYRGTAKRINIAGFEERVVIEHVAACTAGFSAVDAALAGSGAASSAVALLPLRDLVRAAAAAISSAPEKLICGRADCADCAARASAIESAVHHL